MASSRPGCLGALFGLTAGGQPRLTGPSLPALVGTRYAVEDRTAVAAAHRTGERCIALLSADDAPLPGPVSAEVTAEVVALVERVHALADTLTRGRKWLRDNDPDRLARQRAGHEIELLGAELEARPALQQTIDAVDARIAHSGEVRLRVGHMAEALARCAGQLEATEARIQRVLLGPGDERGPAEVVRAVRDQAAAVDRAMAAYSATVDELRDER
jgi:hypothetical protein